MPYLLAAGLAILAGTGYAVFSSAFPDARTTGVDNASQDWLNTPLADAPEPESEQIANAIFEEEADAAAEHPAQRQPQAANVPSLSEQREALTGGTTPMEGAPAANLAEPAAPGAYYVQLASYRIQEDADAHVAELAGRKLQAKAVAYGGPSAGWWHAVRMGPFKERADAEAQRFTLEAHERRAAYVLPRANGKFHVQVASFAEVEQAEQVAKRFSAEGHATKVTRVRMSGKYWHCVRIGPFDTREEALGYKRLVRDIPGSQSTVIPFGPPEQAQES